MWLFVTMIMYAMILKLANSHNDHEVCNTIPLDAVPSLVIDSRSQSVIDVEETI